jgi:hypothetical protein
VVEAGEPCDEQPADHCEGGHPDGDPRATGFKPTAAAEVAATNREIGGAIGTAAGESLKRGYFRHLLCPTRVAGDRLRPPRYAQVSCNLASLGELAGDAPHCSVALSSRSDLWRYRGRRRAR